MVDYTMTKKILNTNQKLQWKKELLRIFENEKKTQGHKGLTKMQRITQLKIRTLKKEIKELQIKLELLW